MYLLIVSYVCIHSITYVSITGDRCGSAARYEAAHESRPELQPHPTSPVLHVFPQLRPSAARPLQQPHPRAPAALLPRPARPPHTSDVQSPGDSDPVCFILRVAMNAISLKAEM